MPVGRLWGVGEKTGEVLGRLAVRTIGDLANTPEAILARLLGEQSARHLTQLSHGIDVRDVVPYEAPKSVGHEETFEHDLDDDETILRELLALSGRVAARLRADGYQARTVTMKVRLATFTTLTRSKTLPDATDVGAELYQVVAGLHRSLPGERRRVRLLGVQASGLGAGGRRTAGAAARRAMGRGRTGGGPHRAPVRPWLGDARLAAGPRAPRPVIVWVPTSGSLPIIGGVPRRSSMPLSEHEQRILEEIERRLAEDDPKLVEQVGRTDLYTHLARRIRLSAVAFLVGFVLLLLFVLSPWIAAVGFLVMIGSALLIYRYLGQLGRDQIRAMQAEGGIVHRHHRPARIAVPPALGHRRRVAPSVTSPFGWFHDHRDLAACRPSASCCTTGSPSPWARVVGRCSHDTSTIRAQAE